MRTPDQFLTMIFLGSKVYDQDGNAYVVKAEDGKTGELFCEMQHPSPQNDRVFFIFQQTQEDGPYRDVEDNTFYLKE